VAVGKLSFGADKLCENALTLIESIKNAKPASVKGEFVKSLFLSSTMGPGCRTNV